MEPDQQLLDFYRVLRADAVRRDEAHQGHRGPRRRSRQVAATIPRYVQRVGTCWVLALLGAQDRKSTRLNSSHANISYAVFCLKKKKNLTMYSELKTT